MSVERTLKTNNYTLYAKICNALIYIWVVSLVRSHKKCIGGPIAATFHKDKSTR